jgi:hypothetical protein
VITKRIRPPNRLAGEVLKVKGGGFTVFMIVNRTATKDGLGPVCNVVIKSSTKTGSGLHGLLDKITSQLNTELQTQSIRAE